jgi:hypothetical protein
MLLKIINKSLTKEVFLKSRKMSKLISMKTNYMETFDFRNKFLVFQFQIDDLNINFFFLFFLIIIMFKPMPNYNLFDGYDKS